MGKSNGATSQVNRGRDVIPKCDCKVKMYIVHRGKSNVREVTSLVLEHNHEVLSPTKMNLMIKKDM